MTLDQFAIGAEFWCSGRRFRCTDIGTRVVVAIRVDEATITQSDHGVLTNRTLTGEEAEREGWFNGPPYAVLESVFDEYDFEGCSLDQNGD